MFGQNVGFNGFTFNSSVQTNNSLQTAPASSSTLSEKIHKALDVAGFFGDLPDAINAIIYLIEGNYKEAGWAAVSLLTFCDAFSKGRKVALNAIPEVVEFAGKYGDDIVDSGRQLAKHGDDVTELALKKTSYGKSSENVVKGV